MDQIDSLKKYQTYNDNTLLKLGENKFVSLCRVNPTHLLQIYKKGKKNPAKANNALMVYIEKNMDKINARLKGILPIPKLEIRCVKQVFPSEKSAKEKLGLIEKTKQEHKKPIRVYECEKCSGWHLTSIPIKEWTKEWKEKVKNDPIKPKF